MIFGVGDLLVKGKNVGMIVKAQSGAYPGIYTVSFPTEKMANAFYVDRTFENGWFRESFNMKLLTIYYHSLNWSVKTNKVKYFPVKKENVQNS